MSKLSEAIFHGEKHKITSPFGKRAVIKTAVGYTSPFHNGTDYGTYAVKLAQYAIADGVVESCGKDSTKALYVWIRYPELKVRMLHYHLDRLNVRKGQSVNKNTIIGYTGKTGKATGIHLHLGIKRIGSDEYIDAEKWSKQEFEKKTDKYKVGNYKVTKAQLLHVRSGAGTQYTKKRFCDLSANAQKKVLTLNGKNADGYVKGVTFSVLEVNGNWGRTPSGWVCLDYCEVI